MLTLLTCFVLSGASLTALPPDQVGRLFELRCAFPAGYSASDFRAYLRPDRPEESRVLPERTPGSALALHRRHERLVLRIPDTHRPGDLMPRLPRVLEVESRDGLYQGSAPVPFEASGELPAIELELAGGSAFGVFVEEVAELRRVRARDAIRRPARLELTPLEGPAEPLAFRVELGSSQRVTALTPGRYRYRVWSDLSGLREGTVELAPGEFTQVSVRLVPPAATGEIRVTIREREPAPDDVRAVPALFFLLESTAGPERLFSAQSPELAVAKGDAPIRWRLEGGRRVGEAVFRGVPKGEYRLSTSPGFGLTPEVSFVSTGGAAELELAGESLFR